MLTKTVWINGGIGLTILGIAGGAFFIIEGAPSTTAAGTRTIAVSTADLSAVATASGNVSPAGTTVLNAQNCTGPILSVAATVGQQVAVGQVLVRIDPTNAANALAVAQAQLDSADQQAAAQQASNGNQVASANQNLANAQQSAALDASQQAAAVTSAQNAVGADNSAVSTAQAKATANPDNQQDQQALTSAQSQLSKDKASLVQAGNQQATANLKDSQQVASDQTQLNNAENPTSAAANNTSAQIAVQTDQANLASCTLKAPIAGTVTAVNAVAGGTTGGSSASSSGSGSGSSAGTTAASASSGLVTISDTKHLQVVAGFAEANVTSLKVGDTATFTFPALAGTSGTSATSGASSTSGTTVTGKVASIAQTATTTNNVVTYPVTVTIDNPPAVLRLGQSANISVTTSQAPAALAIPSLAITANGSRQTVRVMQNGSAQTVVITTGITDNGETQVLSGLTSGEEVVLPTISATLQTGTTTTRTGGGLGGFTGGGGSGFGGGANRGNGG